MPIVTKPNMNYGLWADNGNIEIPSSEKVTEGWVIEKPLNEQMNWLQNRSDRMLQYLNQRGIAEWDIRTEYPEGAYVSRVGRIYKSVSQNLDADPTLNSEIWEIAFVSYNEFAEYAETVDSVTGEDGYLSYYVKKSSPELDAPAKGISYNNKTANTGLSFEGEVPVIKSDGTNIAEFSGGTNPKDVVTHEQLTLAIQNYKVGDIYITANSGDPSERLGYGTWQRFAEGRTLVGFSTSVSNSIPEWTKVIGSQFGAYDHKLTINEMPRHTHNMNFTTGNITGNDRPATQNTSASSSNLEVAMTGGDASHNNVQPSLVVFFWKRLT